VVPYPEGSSNNSLFFFSVGIIFEMKIHKNGEGSFCVEQSEKMYV
jgi:hypothetical protein